MNKKMLFLFIGSAGIFAAVMTHLIKPDSPEEQIMEQAIKVETGLDIDLSPNNK